MLEAAGGALLWWETPLYFELKQALDDERKHLNKVLIEHKSSAEPSNKTHHTTKKLISEWMSSVWILSVAHRGLVFQKQSSNQIPILLQQPVMKQQ